MADRVKPEDELFIVGYPYFNVNGTLTPCFMRDFNCYSYLYIRFNIFFFGVRNACSGWALQRSCREHYKKTDYIQWRTRPDKIGVYPFLFYFYCRCLIWSMIRWFLNLELLDVRTTAYSIMHVMQRFDLICIEKEFNNLLSFLSDQYFLRKIRFGWVNPWAIFVLKFWRLSAFLLSKACCTFYYPPAKDGNCLLHSQFQRT